MTLESMDIINCQNCFAEVPPEGTAIIHTHGAGGRYQERKHCCPYCDTVLLLEVTMAEDESLAAPALLPLAG